MWETQAGSGGDARRSTASRLGGGAGKEEGRTEGREREDSRKKGGKKRTSTLPPHTPSFPMPGSPLSPRSHFAHSFSLFSSSSSLVTVRDGTPRVESHTRRCHVCVHRFVACVCIPPLFASLFRFLGAMVGVPSPLLLVPCPPPAHQPRYPMQL